MKTQIHQLSGGECVTPDPEDLLIVERHGDHLTQYLRLGRLLDLAPPTSGTARFNYLGLLNTTTGNYHRVTLMSEGGALTFHLAPAPEEFPSGKFEYLEFLNQTTGRYHRVTLVADGNALALRFNPEPEPA